MAFEHMTQHILTDSS